MLNTLTKAAVIIIGLGTTATAGTITGPVTHVRDGDTIEVSGQAVRLQGLTCDEAGTALGDRATRAMRFLVQGQVVTCDLTGAKTYDRAVGRCQLSSGLDLGKALIAEGLCGRCDRYDSDGFYADLQARVGEYSGRMPKYCK